MLGRVQVPPSVKRGDVFEVRVIVQHPMETGFRRDYDGKLIPLHIVDRLSCTYGGREVFGRSWARASRPIPTSSSPWSPCNRASSRSSGATIAARRAASPRW